jgi:hypothetical protein
MMIEHQASAPSLKTGCRKRRRLWTVLTFVLLGLGVAFFVTAEILLQRAEPILRSRVINTLATRFDSRVDLPELDISVWHGLEVTGKGLKLYPRALMTANDPDHDQPIFAVGQFSFHTDWWNLLRSPMHISEVSLSDLTIYRPNREQRAQLKAANPPTQDAHREKIEIVADRMLIDRALLLLTSSHPGRPPLQFRIESVQLQNVGANQPLRFHAILVNPKPIGNIDSSGYFGPFDVHEPGNSPVRGDYSFSHADLNTIKGIGGMLSSTGRYEGQLSRITVDGATDTPNFSLDVSGSRPVPLHTKFHAIVDGMNGNTYLQPVDAMLAHSHIVAKGEVTRAPKESEPGQFGRRVQLDVVVGPANIADMLWLVVKTSPPLLRGGLQLTAKLDIPPGEETVAQRMRLKGRFSIRNATFSNEKIQKDLEQLSLRGQGEPKEAKAARLDGLHSVESQMNGDFDLADAKMTFAGLNYSVPGADIGVAGVYSLDGSQFDFRGKVRLQARLSQMVTGWRSWLLKPVDPFFAKHGAGTEIPFTVTGTKADPKFGIDIFHHEVQFGGSHHPKGSDK